jgi:hypothetical protein
MTRDLPIVSNNLRILAVTSDAREGDIECGVEVELTSSSLASSRLIPDDEEVVSLDLSTPRETPLDAYSRKEEDLNGVYAYVGPFLPDTYEIDDIVDGRCSPLYNFKRKASRSKLMMEHQLTNPTLSVNSMTDQSECLSSTSDEIYSTDEQVCATEYPFPRASQSDLAHDEPEKTTIYLINEASLSFNDSNTDDASSVTSHTPQHSASLSVGEHSLDTVKFETNEVPGAKLPYFGKDNSSATSYTPSHSATLLIDDRKIDTVESEAIRVVAGPKLPPAKNDAIHPIINVIDLPPPDQTIFNMVQRSYQSLFRITLNQPNLESVLTTLSTQAHVPYRHDKLPAFLVMRERGPLGFVFACCQQTDGRPSTPLLFYSNTSHKDITLRDATGKSDACLSAVQRFRLASEASTMKAQLTNCTSDTHTEPSTEDETDSISSLSYEDATSLIHDEELRTFMVETKGGNDISRLLQCFSEDNAGSFDTDDGLRNEITELGNVEEALRNELQNVDLDAKGVSIHDVQMKCASSESLFLYAERNQNWSSTPTPLRRVRFAKKNKQYVFKKAEPAKDKTEGIGELILGTFEELYNFIEAMTEEVGYACLSTCESSTDYNVIPETRASTIHY